MKANVRKRSRKRFEAYTDSEWSRIAEHLSESSPERLDIFRELFEGYGRAYEENYDAIQNDKDKSRYNELAQLLGHIESIERLASSLYSSDGDLSRCIKNLRDRIEIAEGWHTARRPDLFLMKDRPAATDRAKARRWYLEIILRLLIKDPQKETLDKDAAASFNSLFVAIASPVLQSQDRSLIERGNRGRYDNLRKEVEKIKETGYLYVAE